MRMLRPDHAVSFLPLLRVACAARPGAAIRLHWSFLARGLLVLVALALPAFGIRLADATVRSPAAGAMQAAAIRRSPPAWTAAALSGAQPR